MSEKNVQDYLEKGLYGAPQLKADEKRCYLGNFRERVYFTILLAEMNNPIYQKMLKTELQKYPESRLFLNSQLTDALQDRYISLAQQANTSFTLVNTDSKKNTTPIGLVLAGKLAVNIPIVAAEEKNVPSETTHTSKNNTTEKSFFSRFFHN